MNFAKFERFKNFRIVVFEIRLDIINMHYNSMKRKDAERKKNASTKRIAATIYLCD